MPTATVTIASLGDITEGGTSNVFRLTRTETSGTLTVNVSYSGTATSGDYTNTLIVMFMNGQSTTDITITPTNDSTSEPTETVICTVTTGTGYTVGSPASATMNILDNDAQVVTVEKVNDIAEGSDGTFRFSRIGDLSSSQTVNFTVGGTATSGTDYTSIGTTVTFAAGAATADVVVDATSDVGTFDPDETVSVTVASGSGYSIGAPSSATLTIRDHANNTFTVSGNTGAIWYDLAWEDVDPEEAEQSIPLDNFTLTFAGHTFTEANADFTTEPTAEFEYGELVGITFAINTSAVSGFAYSSIASAGFTVSLVVAATQQTVTADVKDYGSGTLNFANATNDVARWKVDIKLTYCDEFLVLHDFTFSKEFNNNTESDDIVNEFRVTMAAFGVTTTVSVNGEKLTMGGVEGWWLVGIEYKTYSFNQANNNFVYNSGMNKPVKQGGSSFTTVSINPP